MTPIAPLDRSQEAALRALVDGKAKPLGALGLVEDLAVRLALIAGRPNPQLNRALLLVFAGDHGLNESGVSAYPSEVTTALVATLLAGQASANAFARVVGADVRVVDAGFELAFWEMDEFKDDPACVLGALVGAAKGCASSATSASPANGR